jgi:hypothetical protein
MRTWSLFKLKSPLQLRRIQALTRHLTSGSTRRAEPRVAPARTCRRRRLEVALQCLSSCLTSTIGIGKVVTMLTRQIPRETPPMKLKTRTMGVAADNPSPCPRPVFSSIFPTPTPAPTRTRMLTPDPSPGIRRICPMGCRGRRCTGYRRLNHICGPALASGCATPSEAAQVVGPHKQIAIAVVRHPPEFAHLSEVCDNVDLAPTSLAQGRNASRGTSRNAPKGEKCANLCGVRSRSEALR